MKSKEVSHLYHYTSLSTLQKIVDSNSLWLTHISYLNDSTEFDHYFHEWAEFLQGILKSSNFISQCAIFMKKQGYPVPGDHIEYVQKVLQNILEYSQSNWHGDHSNYVFSLSEKGDLLSQWRGYTSYGDGVSIGFKKR